MGRAGPTKDGGSTAAAPRGPHAHALRVGLLLPLTAFLIELAFVVSQEDALPSALRMRGLLAGLGLGLLLAVPCALAVGALQSLVGRQAPADRPRALSAWLWDADPERQVPRVAGVLAVLLLGAMGVPAAYMVTRALILGIARPHFAAAAIVGAHLTLAALALLLFPLLRAACRTLAERGQQPGVASILGRAGSLLSLLAAVFAVALLVVLKLFWGTFEYLPWRTLSATLGAVALVAAWLWLVPRLQRAAARVAAAIELALLGLGVVAGLGALVFVGGAGQQARSAMRDTLVGELGNAVALFTLDFDRDRTLPVFGGGDCAPFDALISPLALDVPGNGVDEDCDGVDLDERMLGAEVRRDHPLPEGFPAKPAVVLITVDAFAATRMKAFGYPRSITPHIDAFARRGTFFRYGFAQGPSTRLSFPAMFTSRFDTQIAQRLVGSHPYPIEDSELLLAEVLQKAGYETVAVLSDAYFRRSRWASLTQGFGKLIDTPIKKGGLHNSKHVTDTAIDVLGRPRKKPLFMWVHYYDAHSPHAQPEDVAPFGTTRGDVYDAELQLVDREVGRLLGTIEARLPERALVMLTGDHGIAFDEGRHGRFNYGYDLSTPVLHVPLIVAGPHIRRQVLDSVVSTMDVAPTVTNLLGLRRPRGFEGASLAPELFEGRLTRPPRLMHQFFLQERLWEQREPLEQISLRTDRYNLVHDRTRGVYALYDFRADYLERNNLADSPEHARELQTLKQQLALMTYRVYARARPAAAQAAARVSGR